MAADGAQFQKLATLAPKPMHTRIAQDFLAEGALVSYSRSRMASAKHPSIIKHNRRRGSLYLKLGNGYSHLGRLHQDLNLAHAKALTGCQLYFLYGISIKKGAVRGAQVAQSQPVVTEENLAMNRGDGGMFDCKIIIGTASKSIAAQLKLEDLPCRNSRF